MAFLFGAEQMVNPSTSTIQASARRPPFGGSRPLIPGRAHRSLPNSAVRVVPECISCGLTAEHQALRCGHNYCSPCYKKLFDADTGTFHCDREHDGDIDGRCRSTSTRWKSRSSGYETIHDSGLASRATNVSSRSGVLRSVLEKFCLWKSEEDEGFGSAEVPYPEYPEEFMFPDERTQFIPSCATTSMNDSAPGDDSTDSNIFSDAGFGEIIQLPPYDSYVLATESVSNVGRPAEPLEPETVIDQPLAEVVVDDPDAAYPPPQFRYGLQQNVLDTVTDRGNSKYQFDGANSILYDSVSQSLLIADSFNHRVKKYDIAMNPLGFCAYEPKLNDGQFRKPIHLAPHEGRILTTDCGPGPADTEVKLFNINGQLIRRIGGNRLVDPSHMDVLGDLLYVLDCGKIKQFRLSTGNDENDEDQYLGELDLGMFDFPPEFGVIQCIRKPDPRRLFIADDKCILCVVPDSCHKIPLTQKPVDMIVDSSGFLLALFNDSIRVFTPLPNVVLYHKITLPPVIDYRSFALLPNGTLVCCGFHGYTHIEFRSTSTISPSEDTERADPVGVMINLGPTRV